MEEQQKNGKILPKLKFDDNTTLIARGEEAIVRMIKLVNQENYFLGLGINLDKT